MYRGMYNPPKIRLLNMLMSPSVSIVMTTYNCERYVRDAMESILNQTYKDFEFIIVDDASTDRTFEIIAGIQDERIVRLRNERNFGQTKSLNRGIRQSRGHYIARMDADDISHPRRLEKQYRYLEAHPEIAVVGCWHDYIDAQGRYVKTVKMLVDPLKIKCYLAVSGDLSFWCVPHPAVLMRKSALEEVGFYSEKEGMGQGYPQDYELWSKLTPQFRFTNLPESLFTYRVLPNSDSRFRQDIQIAARNEVTRNKIRRFLPDLQESEIMILTDILENRPQVASWKGEKAFDLFERYFQAYMAEDMSIPLAEKIMWQMEFFYLPKLFKTNPLLSVKGFFKIVIRYPSFIFDIKFYRKIVKSLTGKF